MVTRGDTIPTATRGPTISPNTFLVASPTRGGDLCSLQRSEAHFQQLSPGECLGPPTTAWATWTGAPRTPSGRPTRSPSSGRSPLWSAGTASLTLAFDFHVAGHPPPRGTGLALLAPILHPCLRRGGLTDGPPWRKGRECPARPPVRSRREAPSAPRHRRGQQSWPCRGWYSTGGPIPEEFLGGPRGHTPAPSLYPTKADTLISSVHFLAGPEHRREGGAERTESDSGCGVPSVGSTQHGRDSHARAPTRKGTRSVPTKGAPADGRSFCLKIPASSYSESEGLPGGPGQSVLFPKWLHPDWGEGAQVVSPRRPSTCSGMVLVIVQSTEHSGGLTRTGWPVRAATATGSALETELGQKEAHSCSADPALEGTQEVPGTMQRQPLSCPQGSRSYGRARRVPEIPSTESAAQQRGDPHLLPPSSTSKDLSWTKP